MNKIALALSVLLAGCASAPNNSDWSGVIDQQDARTAKIVEMSRAYCDNDSETWMKHYSPEALVKVNDKDLSLEEVTAIYMAGHGVFQDIHHENTTCTTMRYNNGTVWTNYWYDWHGTVRSTGEKLKVRGYACFRWQDGKVVESYNAFDPTQYNAIAAGTSAELK